ncbi:MAG TPA: efflux RND transporter periplasmic adaptor subunit [Candidatus Polarisedimenticolaceae bacterium]|nr:efflux RND transporter periplasmic adaptor subunit [Candidatus Polarisedimenticolaceae bacterium]
MIRRLLFLAVGLGLASCGDKQAATAPPAPAPVVVAKAEVKTVPVAIRSIGNVEAMASVAMRSRVAGSILEVHIADGADVTKGQTLFTIDPEPFKIALAGAEAQLGRDQALLEKAKSDVARYEKLVEKEYVTREQYEGAVAQSGSLAQTIQADKAAVDAARLNVSYCTITAPINGKAGTVMLRTGNLVKANDDPPLVTILQMKPIHVTFSIPEKRLPEVREASAKHQLDVRASNKGETGGGHPGRLAFIDNTVDTTTGTIKLRGEFPNDDRALWPGQYVEVALTVSEQADVVVVPASAIQVGQQGSYVYVVKQDNTAEMRPVQIGRTENGAAIVASGLAGGDTVVIDGQLRVVNGAKVAPKASP